MLTALRGDRSDLATDPGTVDTIVPPAAAPAAPASAGVEAGTAGRDRRRQSTGLSIDVVFAPRRGPRLLVGLLTASALVATGVTGVLAYDRRDALHVGSAGLLLVLTVVLYGILVASPPVQLSIQQGQLEYRRGHLRHVIDLSSRYTPVEMRGVPGRRSWKVLLGRFNAPPIVVDGTMVDSRAFTEAVRRYRPSL